MKAMVKAALTNFQKFFGLPPTGKMDGATEKAMQLPRCAEKDMSPDELHTRRRRYAHWGERWSKRHLSYRIHKYSQKSLLSRAAVDEEMALAFAAWASVTDLVFRQVSEKADINISFFRGEHGDGTPFDGKGNMLGHANRPPGGMLLYGPRRHHPPDLCLNSSFDAIFENPDGIIYVLQGRYYWKLSPDGFVNSYPLLISHHWAELPGDMDAAFATSSGTTYFFKGTKYWVYTYTRLHPGYPKLISEGWPGIPSDIDAATWYTSSVFYFFKEDVYWIYDSRQPSSVNGSRPMTEWGNIAGDLDDVMYIRSGYMYFFSKGHYYRFNCKTKLVDSVWPDQQHYPRAVAPWWFRCSSKETKA
ncbi:hypothetical protein Cfor_11665 [Coptotermes formosanus]|uniref:Matrix metalloproteinase-14 n=1 Tax=Coptotermes formosanus TaxID=36987 RepID=A0A6L2PLT1_COPFO|nr:hypothetical protein Cfor_11665 [Coptotermes formosanus]